MKTSKMAQSITPSLTRKLFNMANEIGEDVINLTLGDPDVLTPIEVREEACNAIMSGKTRYSANAGLETLRESYARFFEKHYNLKINYSKNLIATVGGMEALYLSLASIIDKGDEIIVLAPYYVNYLQMITMLGGKAITVDTLNKTDEQIMIDIKTAVSDKTIGIIVNSPCNPTGSILSSFLIDEIAECAIDNDLIVISDEVYSSLVYDHNIFDSIITREDMLSRTILIDSCSKRFAMTGWRIGVAVGPEEIVSCMIKMQENIVACAPLSSQYGAIKAYTEDFDYSYIKDTYQHRRDIVYNAINNNPLLFCEKPQATFYCFVNIKNTGLSSEEFAYALLEKYHVAVVPGVSYGKEYCNYIRHALTLNDDLLTEAMKRIEKFCEDLKK